jgi:hypothetical protein
MAGTPNDPGFPFQWNYNNTGDYAFENQNVDLNPQYTAEAAPGCDVFENLQPAHPGLVIRAEESRPE